MRFWASHWMSCLLCEAGGGGGAVGEGGGGWGGARALRGLPRAASGIPGSCRQLPGNPAASISAADRPVGPLCLGFPASDSHDMNRE